jgi:hypothetical protein
MNSDDKVFLILIAIAAACFVGSAWAIAWAQWAPDTSIECVKLGGEFRDAHCRAKGQKP